ncbi:efflux RND transporter periplasmic adaptor subunit [Noviherbaspirillum aerium]|uniref:efflux RND transporter periplasmic adaptor subunit n=1 Tax=Noviherbaspirillum aerium TaxID=2588497 RepID=UPI00124EECAB|nr:efflux RND transporter periplasmic adaptor subunit [Noviherbaspirillum aerium]
MKRLKLKPITLALIAVATIAVIALTAASLLSGKRGAAEDKSAATPPKAALTVTTVKPERIDAPLKLVANGNIAAWQEAIVGSESNGLRLTEVRVNVGDRVKAGQVLATFAAETGKADVAQARAALLEAQANAADAAANAARARTLTETGALSTQQINQYLTTEQTAKAKVEAARAMLAAQELRLKQTRLTAPDDGVISSRSATVGAVVPAGTELFRLIRQGRLEWRAEVTSSELGRLRTGSTALVTAANGTQLKGSVRTFAPTVDPQTRIALVYVDLPQSSERDAPPKAGMFARGEFDLGSSKALTVPQQSVVVRDGFSYVFRVNPDNRVSQVKVQTGRRLSGRIEILDGMADDAVLVGNGAGFLNDGDLVKVVSPASK